MGKQLNLFDYDYSNIKIIPLPFTRAKSLEDGTWRWVWKMEFTQALTENLVSQALPQINQDMEEFLREVYAWAESKGYEIGAEVGEAGEYTVSIQLSESHQCNVVIRLTRDHQSEEFHWATFRLFDSINRHIGQVETIEGVKYEQWMKGRSFRGEGSTIAPYS
jgi:hypothetical protein